MFQHKVIEDQVFVEKMNMMKDVNEIDNHLHIDQYMMMIECILNHL